MTLTMVLAFTTLVGFLGIVHCLPSEDRLLQHIVGDGYRKHLKPQEKVAVSFGLTLTHVLDVKTNAKSADVDMQLWYKMLWHDERLQWDPANYDGITDLRVSNELVWKPDIINANSLNAVPTMNTQYHTVVYSTGQVLWVPIVNERVRCERANKDLKCSMNYMSWVFDGNTFDPDFYEGEEKVDLSSFSPLSDYQVTANVAEKKTVYYPCCKEPYPKLTFNVTLSPN